MQNLSLVRGKMNKNSIGNRIKQLRKQKHLSVDKLSSITGISRATIYRYENGEIEKPPYTALVSLSKALDTTSDFLIGANDDNYCTIKLTGDDLTDITNFINYLKDKRG